MAELKEVDAEVVQGLRDKLLGAETPLPEKYRCLFSLRNVAGQAAHEALLEGGWGGAGAKTGCMRGGRKGRKVQGRALGHAKPAPKQSKPHWAPTVTPPLLSTPLAPTQPVPPRPRAPSSPHPPAPAPPPRCSAKGPLLPLPPRRLLLPRPAAGPSGHRDAECGPAGLVAAPDVRAGAWGLGREPGAGGHVPGACGRLVVEVRGV